MNEIDKAIVLYVGWKISPFPKEDESRVLSQFGPDEGSILVEEVRSILDELQKSEPDWQKYDLIGASKSAVGQLKLKYPQLGDTATSALEWIYSWWWK